MMRRRMSSCWRLSCRAFWMSALPQTRPLLMLLLLLQLLRPLLQLCAPLCTPTCSAMAVRAAPSLALGGSVPSAGTLTSATTAWQWSAVQQSLEVEQPVRGWRAHLQA